MPQRAACTHITLNFVKLSEKLYSRTSVPANNAAHAPQYLCNRADEAQQVLQEQAAQHLVPDPDKKSRSQSPILYFFLTVQSSATIQKNYKFFYA